MSFPQGEITVPCGIEIPPIPLAGENLQVYGLPQGLVSCEDDNGGGRHITGTPKTIGTYGIVIMPLGLCFQINVIPLPKIPIHIDTITDMKYKLGQKIDPLAIKCNDPRVEIVVTGLPQGLIYNQLNQTFTGIPDVIGHFPITIELRLFSQVQYSTSFSIDIEGQYHPSINIDDITLQEVVSDQDFHFHQVDDQLIFTFTIKNNGTVTLYQIQLDDPILGHYESPRILHPMETLRVNCLHYVTQTLLDRGYIDLQTIVTAHPTGGSVPNVTSVPRTLRVNIRGHDTTHLLTKIIQTTYDKDLETIKYSFIVFNGSDDIVNDITVHDGGSRGHKVTLVKNKLRPNGLLIGTLSHKGKLKMIGDKLNLWITGITSSLIGNIFQKKMTFTCDPQVIVVRAKHYLVQESQPVTLSVKFGGGGSCSHVRVYDGIKMVGDFEHGSITFNIEPGRHIVYVVDPNTDQGSNIIMILVGDEKNFSKEDLKTAKTSSS